MGNFWWLEPGWGDACCMACGVNIMQSGGDPDWGYCLPCFDAHMNEQRAAEEAEEAARRRATNDGEG